MKRKAGRKSIFRSLFVPMIAVMILQALIFYTAAVYGGLEESLKQNAADILSERLHNRSNEIETVIFNRWINLDNCIDAFNAQYANYEKKYGEMPFAADTDAETEFLRECGDELVDTLRYSQANGIFLILNNSADNSTVFPPDGEQKYGICIRDMDQDSSFSGREDLLLERSPSSAVDTLGCLLDSWWEAKYSFKTEAEGDYYYAPLNAARKGLSRDSKDLAYLSGAHRISGSDPEVVSYSLPLIDSEGRPYAVLGIEISVQHFQALLPSDELHENDMGCYILAFYNETQNEYEPIIGTGTLSKRYFGEGESFTPGEVLSLGGFSVKGKDGSDIYTTETELEIYNNNSPFENKRIVLLAAVESDALFSYIERIELVLFIVSLISLALGIAALAAVSRRFASPITALAKRVRGMKNYDSAYKLERLGITEIDQLVDSIEELNRNVSKNSARTEFFSRMSHDMRTPMNAIISFSSAEMLEGTDEHIKDDYLDKIHSSGLYLLGLINEVLDMTKIESNQTGLQLAVTPAKRLFGTPVHVTEELAQKKHVVFATHIHLPDSLYVMVDEQHLNQVVMNLLSNAVKFTNEGGTVRFTADILEEPTGLVCRAVISDTGIGMSDEFMKNLYMPFEQENGNHEGTGLGLSIAKKLVEMMGGTIECKSKKNAGTVFTVTVPLVPTESSGEASEGDGSTKTDIARLSGKRVLVSEDNNINTTIITLLLSRVGLLTEVAENGRLCLEMFEGSEPGYYDLILMDIRMPVMDGLEASKAIRALTREDGQTIPIIAMTADAFAEDAEGCFAAGMNEHLSKPIEPDKLYSTLLKYI